MQERHPILFSQIGLLLATFLSRRRQAYIQKKKFSAPSYKSIRKKHIMHDSGSSSSTEAAQGNSSFPKDFSRLTREWQYNAIKQAYPSPDRPGAVVHRLPLIKAIALLANTNEKFRDSFQEFIDNFQPNGDCDRHSFLRDLHRFYPLPLPPPQSINPFGRVDDQNETYQKVLIVPGIIKKAYLASPSSNVIVNGNLRNLKSERIAPASYSANAEAKDLWLGAQSFEEYSRLYKSLPLTKSKNPLTCYFQARRRNLSVLRPYLKNLPIPKK